jgi:dihydroflavonol-4-reductase
VNETPSVRKVILTSSVAAIFGDAKDIEKTSNNVFTEKEWNETSSVHHQPYSYSKTVAEKEAWKMRKKQDRWDLVVLNPGFVLGPSLTDRKDSTSISLMIQMGNGTFKMGAPELYNGIVDVRDVAHAHVQAVALPHASGRHILVREVLAFPEMGHYLKEAFPQYPLPQRTLPKWLVWLFGPLQGISRAFVSRNVGYPIRFDTQYTKDDLQMDFRPVKDTLTDHFQQLIDQKAI